MGFEQFYKFQNTTYPSTFQDIGRPIRHFWMGFFCDLLQILTIKYDPADVNWPWPWVTEKPINWWCVSFETECTLCIFNKNYESHGGSLFCTGRKLNSICVKPDFCAKKWASMASIDNSAIWTHTIKNKRQRAAQHAKCVLFIMRC